MMRDELEIETNLVGKTISRMVEISDRYNKFYRVFFIGGGHIDFYGGATSSENTDPTYEVVE